MPKLLKLALLLTSAVVLAACQSPPAAPALPVKPPQIPPLPLELQTPREPNLTQRLLKLLSPSPTRETKPSASGTPASSNTTPPAKP